MIPCHSNDRPLNDERWCDHEVFAIWKDLTYSSGAKNHIFLNLSMVWGNFQKKSYPTLLYGTCWYFFCGGVQDFRKQCSNVRLVKSGELLLLFFPYLRNPDTKLESPRFLDHGSLFYQAHWSPLVSTIFLIVKPRTWWKWSNLTKEKNQMGWNRQVVKHHFLYISNHRIWGNKESGDVGAWSIYPTTGRMMTLTLLPAHVHQWR